MKRKGFGIAPVTLRSMPFWCVDNPVSDPFGGAVLEKINSVPVAELLAEAAEKGLIEATSFHDDDIVPWDPQKPKDDLDPSSEVYKTMCALKKILTQSGSQIKAQFDNDFPPLIGPEGLKETVQMFWALRKVGWKGVVEFDCHMLRVDTDPADPIGCGRKFIEDCIRALSIALLLADRLIALDTKTEAVVERHPLCFRPDLRPPTSNL